MRPNLFLLATILLSFFFSTKVYAIDFTYLNGTATSGYTTKGAPTNLVDRSAELPIDVLSNIYSMLPESQYVNPAYIDESLSSNIIVDDDFTGVMTANITFLNEGAGYRNAFGYFIYDPDSPPATYNDISEHKIIFPNSSKPDEGELIQGHNVDLEVNLIAGQAMGFFIVPNGWGWSGSDGHIQSLGPWGQPFYSLPHLNPESSELQAHNVVFYDAVNDFLVFGFDDQKRTQGDNDFNDILVSIETTPIYAIQGINEDGSVDANTYQVLEQSNTEVTSTTYYPSQHTNATLMFEDLWPRIGDYDFNDLIINYRFTNTLNNRNDLLSMKLNFQIQSVGATYHNGFALHLPNVAATNIASSSLSKDGIEIKDDLLDPNNTEANFVLLDNVMNNITSQCHYFRTLTNCKDDISGTYVATITFSEPVEYSDIGSAPYDPYIFAIDGKYHGIYGGRGWEVHLKQFSGSDLFSTGFMGVADDDSTIQNSFVNSNNFPWVLNIPDSWDHPQENVDILNAYPKFSTWVLSSGEEETDWYLRSKSNSVKLYE